MLSPFFIDNGKCIVYIAGMENKKTEYETPIPITFKKLKQLVRNLESTLKDDTPVILMDLNEVFYHILEVQTFGENSKEPVFAAISFEPFVMIDKKLDRSGKLDMTEQTLQRLTGYSVGDTRKLTQLLNSHGYFIVSLDELGTLRKEVGYVPILQAQNDELREHIDGLLIDMAEQQEHIDRLLDMVSAKKVKED